MPKFRKKPIVIEAEVYRPGMEDGITAPSPYNAMDYTGYGLESFKRHTPHWNTPEYLYEWFKPFIKTLEGKMYISKGDYIITGIAGERYPCKPDIFEASYEAVEEGAP
jgi:hypothetical protein